MGEEDWLEAAITDDSLVVELLMRLNQSNASPQPKKTTAALNWSVRQRRSKPIPKLVDSSTKNGELTRASPTTPLSWSGATSISAGSGASEGSEESSRPPKFPDDGRSKVTATTEATNPKRSRKKKTLAELKEEEDLLMKESLTLKNELAVLHATYEKQRVENESLKRMKLDIHGLHIVKTATPLVAISDQTQQKEAAEDHHPPTPAILLSNNNYSEVQNQSAQHAKAETSFLLPDLNLPCEDGFDDEMSSDYN